MNELNRMGSGDQLGYPRSLAAFGVWALLAFGAAFLIGIVTGIVVTSYNGKDFGRTVFTDIFVYRSGRWQAIHAQETQVDKLQRQQ
jgi:hypothetical protein